MGLPSPMRESTSDTPVPKTAGDNAMRMNAAIGPNRWLGPISRTFLQKLTGIFPKVSSVKSIVIGEAAAIDWRSTNENLLT
jgi:hypothetical protein